MEEDFGSGDDEVKRDETGARPLASNARRERRNCSWTTAMLERQWR